MLVAVDDENLQTPRLIYTKIPNSKVAGSAGKSGQNFGISTLSERRSFFAVSLKIWEEKGFSTFDPRARILVIWNCYFPRVLAPWSTLRHPPPHPDLQFSSCGPEYFCSLYCLHSTAEWRLHKTIRLFYYYFFILPLICSIKLLYHCYMLFVTAKACKLLVWKNA